MDDPIRAAVIFHLRAAIRAIEDDERHTARDHVVAARRALGGWEGDVAVCEATASADDTNHHLRYRTFGHMCTGLETHAGAHLCECGHTWGRAA